MSNKPHPETINQEPTVLIIGYGWVGQHIGKYFKTAHWVDELETICKVSDDSPCLNQDQPYDLAFICVPTPMNSDGSCDTSLVEKVVSKYKDRVDYFCIKSTVDVGTTDLLEERYDVCICMSPEYLGETVGHPMNDIKRDPFIVLGGPEFVTKKFAEAWSLVTNSYTKFYFTKAAIAELAKLMDNSYIATKVVLMNEFAKISERMGLSWHEVREIFLADPRISKSHTYVYSGNPGFGGKCLEKDVNNLLYSCKSLIDEEYPKLLEFVLKRNKELKNVK